MTGASVDTDEAGLVVNLIDYYPFGSTRLEESTEDNDYKFTGKELDSETGLYYYGARYYDPVLSRFVSRDTWEGEMGDPQSMNRYSYVVNNPLKYVDPSGNRLVISGVNGSVFVENTFMNLKELYPNISLVKKGSDYTVKINFWNRVGSWFTRDGVSLSLMKKVIDDANTITVNGYIGDTKTGASSETNASNGKGTGGDILFNFRQNPSAPIYNSLMGNIVEAPTPSFIVLGHELIHGSHFLEGSVDTGTDFYSGKNSMKYFDSKEEIRTVGLGFNNKGDISENDLREEHGISQRNHYDGQQKGKKSKS